MAKAKKVKLPKRIGGVKIPKELRKGGARLIEQAQTEDGRAAIIRGAATVAGIAANVARAAAAKRAAKPAEPVAAAPAAPGGPGVAKPDALGDAIGAGAEAVLGRLFPRKS
ncbi:hypothetical protein [Sphingomonas sp.]|uniref:hypothetical protein n=1 Tax=Sphingomonas sp. TaxID=28214 RepID=UPI003CC56544